MCGPIFLCGCAPVSPAAHVYSQDFGYNVDDDTDGLISETYTVYGGDETAIGDYTAQVWIDQPQIGNTWTITARLNGEVEWVEQGVYSPSELSYGFFDSSGSAPDMFTVAIDSIAGSEC